jgi:hypothetical protein
MPKRCPKGTRRNKKTGLCQQKKSPAKKRNTLKQSSSSKLSSSKLSLAKLPSPKQEETLSEKEVDQILDEFKQVLEKKNIDQDIMKRELMKLTYNENYRTQFMDEPADNLWWMAYNMVEQFLREGYKTFNAEQMLKEGLLLHRLLYQQ